MSMREYPNSGYIVELDKLAKLLPPNEQEIYDEIKDFSDNEELLELFEKLPKEIPDFSIYRPSDEDTVDGPMENGKRYAIFDDEALFTREMTEGHKHLIVSGILPVFCNWSVWG